MKRTSIVLISSVEEARLGLLPHFVEHYAAVGVTAFYFVIHVPNSNSRDSTIKAFEGIMNKYGVQWTRSEMTEPYSTRGMRVALDDGQANVRRYADWIVWADSDEFHEYSSPLNTYVKTAKHWTLPWRWGVLMDRFDSDGKLRAIHSAECIWEQFPHGNCFTQDVLGGAIDKVTLARPDVQLTLGNHYAKENPRLIPSNEVIPVHHFKWDRSVVQRLQYRTEPSWKAAHPWWKQSAAGLRRIDVEAERISPGPTVYLGASHNARAAEYLKAHYLPDPDVIWY